MTYTLKSKVDPASVRSVRTLGQAFEQATELLQYMEEGNELIICNDLGSELYSIRFINSKKFTITELV